MTPIEGQAIPLVRPHEAYGAETTPRISEDSASIFEDALASAINSANSAAQKAQVAGENFAAGVSDDIHGTMLTLSQADIQLRLVGNIRNRVVDAFYELWRMQV